MNTDKSHPLNRSRPIKGGSNSAQAMPNTLDLSIHIKSLEKKCFGFELNPLTNSAVLFWVYSTRHIWGCRRLNCSFIQSWQETEVENVCITAKCIWNIIMSMTEIITYLKIKTVYLTTHLSPTHTYTPWTYWPGWMTNLSHKHRWHTNNLGLGEDL